MIKPRVLMIVDTLDIVSLDFRQILDNAGYATELILDSQVVFDQIAYLKPDVIFLHLDLPTISGTILYQLLRNNEQVKEIPVVVLAAHKEVANHLSSLADVVLLRPVKHERLVNLLALLCSIDKPMDQTPWDVMTGFYTPSFFIARLNLAIKKSHHPGMNDFIVFSVNLNQRKSGEEYQQQSLQVAVKVLRKVLRLDDIVSRFKTDKFLVLIEYAVNRYAPVSIAERMQFEFDELLINSGLKDHLNIEIGVLYCSGEYKTTDEVLHDAQLAAEMARKNSRDEHRSLDSLPSSHASYFVGSKAMFSA